jgi:hypothetical protein
MSNSRPAVVNAYRYRITPPSIVRYARTAALSWKFRRATVSRLKIQTTSGGSIAMVSTVEKAIANVLLYASGSNSRASRSSRKKTGRNDARMISSENSSGLVTDTIDRIRISWRSDRLTGPRIDSSAVQFSTITIVASAISPIAIARPASENRLIVWPSTASGSAVNSTLSSRIAIGPMAVRTFRRKSSVTRMSTSSSMPSVSKNCFSVAQIHAERL